MSDRETEGRDFARLLFGDMPQAPTDGSDRPSAPDLELGNVVPREGATAPRVHGDALPALARALFHNEIL